MKILSKILVLILLLPSSFVKNTRAQGDDISLHAYCISDLEYSLLSSLEKKDCVNVFSLFYGPDLEISIEQINAEQKKLDVFINQLGQKLISKTNKQKVKRVFTVVHRRYLKSYKPQVNFSEISRNGGYDCLTGSALYAYIYQQLGFSAEIYASLHHVYLLLYHDGEQYLIESTDPIYGLVTDSGEIAHRRREFDKRTLDGVEYYRFKENHHEQVTLMELSGLHYYNIAIRYFNEQKFEKAKNFLEKSLFLFPSERIREILEITNLYLADQTRVR